MADSQDDVLLALATGKRRSELHALTKNVSWLNGGMRFVEVSEHPDLVGKTQVTTRGVSLFKSVTLNALENADGQDALLCPVRMLEVYLDRTKQFRSHDQQRLIIPYTDHPSQLSSLGDS